MRVPGPAVLAALLIAAASTAAPVETVKRPAPLAKGAQGAAVMRAQVMLDRAWFSPGEIDGKFGEGMVKAVSAFQQSQGLPPTGRVDATTWEALAGGVETVLTPYPVTAKDVAGPFTKTPDDMMERAKLTRLDYEDAVEGLAERFHLNPRLLRSLNPGKRFVEGEQLQVPIVGDGAKPPARAASLALFKAKRILQALDAQGNVIAQFPISVGGPRDELPVGKLTIKTEVRDPSFDYDPAHIHDAKPHYVKTRIAPGPNNPVGVVWLGLSKPHYGIHGTPQPSLIGRRETNGCIHLTNWDALKVAALVGPGTPVDVRP